MREALELYIPEEEQLDFVVEEAFAEIRRRQTLLRELYPVQHQSTHLAKLHSSANSTSFSFLLAVSVQGFYEQTSPRGAAWHEPARLFEYVVTAALRRYLNGKAIRIGTPREAPVPSDFAECLRYMGRETAELARGPLNPSVGEGDEKCDVVAWAPFRDGKAGQVVVLAQCGIGDGWKGKLEHLSDTVWQQQFDWHAPPVRAFAFPYLLDEDPAEWRYISTRGGIPFDRIRISSLVRDSDFDGPIVTRIQQWCEDFARKLPYAD